MRLLHGLCGRCPSPRPGTVSGQARGQVPQRSLLNDGGPGLSLPRWPGSRGGLLSWTLGPALPRRAPRGGQPAPAGLLLGGLLQLPPRCATPRGQLGTATSTCHYGAEWIIAPMGERGQSFHARESLAHPGEGGSCPPPPCGFQNHRPALRSQHCFVFSPSWTSSLKAAKEAVGSSRARPGVMWPGS